ncbi:MAG: LptF/LptG family permease [Rickettsiales bacterium]|jgi:lipopolysaccharide export system permease protein|nr:LptF/LptG family permease [Rickettsiales bacterium]
MKFFPWRTIISRFLSGKFLRAFGLVLFIVSAVILSISFVEELGRADTGGSAFIQAAAKLLEWMPLFLPLVIFMSVLLMTYQLLRSSEMVIITGAGLSPLRITRPLALTAALVGLFASMAINPVSISLNRTISGANSSHMNMVDGKIWLSEDGKDSRMIMSAKGIQIKNDAAAFIDATIINQKKGSSAATRIEAPLISLRDGEFQAVEAAAVYGEDGIPKIARNWKMPSLITAQNVKERYLKPAEIPFWKLPSFIASQGLMGINSRPHLVQFFSLLFMPLTLASMVALGMAFSQTKSRRFFSFGKKFTLGILASFILYFVINLFSNLGAAGFLPPFAAVLLPPMIIAFFSLTYIISFNKK